MPAQPSAFAQVDIVATQLGSPEFAGFASAFANTRSEVQDVRVGKLGDTTSIGFSVRCPTDSWPRLDSQLRNRCGAVGFATKPAAARKRTISYLLTGDDNHGLVARFGCGVKQAGCWIWTFDFRSFPGIDGVGQMTMDVEVVVPENFGNEHIVRQIYRCMPNDAIRIHDGATGKALAVREAGKLTRLPSLWPQSGADREFVLTSNGPDHVGVLAELGSYLAQNEASITRVKAFTIGDRFVAMVGAVASDKAFGGILASYKKKFGGSAHLTGCHWRPLPAAPTEVVYHLSANLFDDLQGVAPIWRVRKAAQRHKVALGCFNAFPYRAPWFGTEMYRIESLVRGTEEAARSFAAEIEPWADKEAAGLDFDRGDRTEFANERELYQPFEGMKTIDGESVFDVFG